MSGRHLGAMNGESTRRVERGQYKPSLGGSGGIVTKTITLSNSGRSLERMALRWNLGGFAWVTGSSAGYAVFNVFGGANSNHYGVLLRAYLSAVDEITLEILESTYSGTAQNAFCYEVERW